MRLFLKVILITLAANLFFSPASDAAFVVSATPVNRTAKDHPRYRSHPRHSFQAMYPGKSKGLAIILALPGVNMLGLAAFYLDQNRIGLIQILCDIIGAALLLLVLNPGFDFLGLFGLIIGVGVGGGLLVDSLIVGMTTLIYILFNLPLSDYNNSLLNNGSIHLMGGYGWMF